MSVDIYTPNIPVLLLYNLDTNWAVAEQEDVLKITSQFFEAISTLGYQTTMIRVDNPDLDNILAGYDPLEQVVFNWCESLPGLDHSEWLVTGYLEQKGFIFTGASAETIALSHDKCRVKQLLDKAKIPTPKWRMYGRSVSTKWGCFPSIVKAAREHCSEGIDRNSVVTDEAELTQRVRYILENYRQPALVEEFIDGRELHVTLWGNDTNDAIEMLPPVEMEFSSYTDPHDRLCTYASKFDPESDPYRNIKTVLPAPLTDIEYQRVEEVCKTAYLVTGCRDYARIDMRLKDGIPYILDINPNSDISPDTSTVAAAEFAGYSYGRFGERLILMAAERHPLWGDLVHTGIPENATKISGSPERF